MRRVDNNTSSEEKGDCCKEDSVTLKRFSYFSKPETSTTLKNKPFKTNGIGIIEK